MRFVLAILFLGACLHAFPQLIIKGLSGERAAFRAQEISEPLPAIGLPFWDDFSTTQDTLSKFWEFSDGVFVNKTLAVNPPTVGVATLDGADANGDLYDPEALFPGLNDQLISRRTDLSSLSADESLYLSFFYQMGGSGELPEESDSLRLQMLDADSIWQTVWKVRADEVPGSTTFEQEILKVESIYRHADFRFKFETFGSLQGPFDTWHIDYVYLDNGRSSGDLNYLDRAFTGSLSSIIAPYYEMPATHFFADPSTYLETQTFQGGNLDDQPHTLDVEYTLENTLSGEVFNFSDGDQSFTSSGVTDFTISQSPNITAVNPAPDSVVFINTISTNTNDPDSPIDYRVNDSLRTTFHFTDYYAYDDGKAEFAAGVRQNGGSIAVEYLVENVVDTLTHIDFYFPKITPLSEGKSITVKAWKSLSRDALVTVDHVISASDRNEFVRVALPNPVIVTDTVFVGFTQKTAEYIGVGLDRNNLQAKNRVYFRTTDQWQKNQEAEGVLMIRPVFAKTNDLVLGELPVQNAVNIFPNPTRGDVRVSGAYKSIQVWDLSGALLLEEGRGQHHDLSRLEDGLYLLKVIRGDSVESFKILIKK